MNSFTHRALALLILLLTLTTLTGAATTVQALVGPGGPDACCAGGLPAEDQEQDAGPCTAECPCASCLVLVQPTPIQPPMPPAASLPGCVILANLHLSTFAPPLDYPPEQI